MRRQQVHPAELTLLSLLAYDVGGSAEVQAASDLQPVAAVVQAATAPAPKAASLSAPGRLDGPFLRQRLHVWLLRGAPFSAFEATKRACTPCTTAGCLGERCQSRLGSELAAPASWGRKQPVNWAAAATS